MDKIKLEFLRIKQLGFIKSNRSHNTGIGKTFEDHLGVKENNLKDPDFDGFEIKSKRFLTNSMLTLFTKSPSHPNKANALLLRDYGYIGKKGKKELHTTLSTGKENTVKGRYGLQLKNDRINKKLYIFIRNLSTKKIISKDTYYSYSDLKMSLKKLNKLFLVSAECKSVRNCEHFHYNNAIVFLDLRFSKFLNMIDSGIIKVDIRMGTNPNGTPHDHGTGFRLKRERLKELYKTYIEIY